MVNTDKLADLATLVNTGRKICICDLVSYYMYIVQKLCNFVRLCYISRHPIGVFSHVAVSFVS